jgi:hypothetical protein
VNYRPAPHTVEREQEPAPAPVTIDPDAAIVAEYDGPEFRCWQDDGFDRKGMQ